MRGVKSNKLKSVGNCIYKPWQTTSLIFCCELLVMKPYLFNFILWILSWTGSKFLRVNHLNSLSGSLNHPKVSFIVWQFVYLWRMAGCCYHRVFLAWSARLFRLVRTSTRNIHINAHKDAQQNIVTGWSMSILSASGFNVLGSLHLSAWKLWKFV